MVIFRSYVRFPEGKGDQFKGLDAGSRSFEKLCGSISIRGDPSQMDPLSKTNGGYTGISWRYNMMYPLVI